MLLAHRLTSAGLEIVDDPIALETALWVDVIDPTTGRTADARKRATPAVR